jgi:hypothetical protein
MAARDGSPTYSPNFFAGRNLMVMIVNRGAGVSFIGAAGGDN